MSHTHSHIHIVSPKLLLAVFAALLALTGLTVGVTEVDVGPFNIWLALGIAVAKASLVALFFMHLRWDSLFNGIILTIALVFVAIFIGITVLDSREYRVNYAPPASVVAP